MIRRVLPVLVELLGPLLIRLIHLTLRVEYRPHDRARVCRDPTSLRGSHIYAFWHQAQLVPAWTQRHRGIAILVSRHGDGELISRVVKRLGFRPVRGSTTRGGAPALKEMIRLAREGRDLAFTPDGPRGPRCRVQPGVIQAASRSGRPIWPAAIAIRHVVRLRSWDRFLIPLPFGRAILRFGPVLHVPPDLDRSEREWHRRELERNMRRLAARTWREIRAGPPATVGYTRRTGGIP